MAIYYIGKSQREIEDLSVFAGSETIFGMNENENYASFSLVDEEKKISETKMTEAVKNLRFGMEKFKFLDKDAKFVFSSQELYDKVKNFDEPEMIANENDVKVFNSLEEMKKVLIIKE